MRFLFFSFFAALLFNTAFSQVPTITSFTPASGVAGSTVTITGTNFSTTPANNVVLFGGVRAQIVGTPTATSIVVKAPKGASYAPITVSIGLLTAYSNKPFILTSACPAPITTTNPYYTALADFDGDSLNDLAIILEGDNEVQFRENTSVIGSISFQHIANPSAGNTPKSIATGDLNGDGKIDVVTTNGNGNAYLFMATAKLI